MGYDNDGIFEIDQEIFQPGDSIQIQVVCRFVQKKDIGIAKKSFGKQDFYLFITVQSIHNGIVEFRIDAKAVQQHGSVGFRFPAVHFGEFAFQLAGAETVFIGEIFFGINRVFFFHDLVKAFVAHNDYIHNGIVVIFEMILLQNGHTLPGSDENIAFCCFQFAGQYFQKRGFTGSVCADKPVTVSFGEFDVYIFE